MATYSMIKQGSKGDDVLELQNLLNQNGYNLATDGIYGSNTAAAVRDYQSKNGLSVDGIVGNQTWTSLYGGGNTGAGANASGSSSGNTLSMLSGYETSGSRPTYNESDELQSLRDQLAAFEGNKPADYQSRYQQQIDDLLSKIMNREPFQYNFDADPLYQQYKDRYTQQGKLAMQDTMAQAAALTGGYGNSYAQQVGQQAYNSNLQALNDVIPELYNQAYGMYRDQGNELRDNLGTYMDLDSIDYSRHRDNVSDYYTELQYLYNKSNDMSDREYQMYLNDADAWEADRNYWLNKVQMEQDQANWQAEYDLAQQKATSAAPSSKDPDDDPGSDVDDYFNPVSFNKSGDIDTIYIPGYGKISGAEFDQLSASGMIEEKKNDYGNVVLVRKGYNM